MAGSEIEFGIVYGPDVHREKKRERKRKNLLILGVNPEDAFSWSRTRMGGWAVAQSPILGTTITIVRLIKRGYESLLDYYSVISLSGNEPLYTRSPDEHRDTLV